MTQDYGPIYCIVYTDKCYLAHKKQTPIDTDMMGVQVAAMFSALLTPRRNGVVCNRIHQRLPSLTSLIRRKLSAIIFNWRLCLNRKTMCNERSDVSFVKNITSKEFVS